MRTFFGITAWLAVLVTVLALVVGSVWLAGWLLCHAIGWSDAHWKQCRVVTSSLLFLATSFIWLRVVWWFGSWLKTKAKAPTPDPSKEGNCV